MSEEEKKDAPPKEEETNVVSIDDGRLKRLSKRGHYISMLEQFDVLRIKFIYDQLTKEEAIKFITLCKYFMNHGHSESIKLTCHYMYKRYIEGQGL